MCKYLMVLLAAVIICSGCGETKKAAGKDIVKETVKEKISKKMKMSLERGEAGTTNCGDFKVKLTPNGFEGKIPPNTKVAVETGEDKNLETNTSSSSVIDKIYNTPWWIYGVGALLVAVGLGLGFYLRSPMIALFGVVGGLSIVTVFVLIQFYTWVFLLLGLLGVAAIVILAIYLYKRKNSDAEAKRIKGFASAVVEVVENAAVSTKEEIKAGVSEISDTLGKTKEHKDIVNDLKHDS